MCAPRTCSTAPKWGWTVHFERQSAAVRRTIDLVREKAEAYAARKEAEASSPELAQRANQTRAEADAEAKAAFEAQREAEALAHMVASGAGEADAQRMLAGLDESWEAVRQARAFFADKSKRLLLMFGDTGRGKTLAALELITLCRFSF